MNNFLVWWFEIIGVFVLLLFLGFIVWKYISTPSFALTRESFFTPAGLSTKSKCIEAKCSWNNQEKECQLPTEGDYRWSNNDNVCTQGSYFAGITTQDQCIQSKCLWDGQGCSAPDNMIWNQEIKQCSVGTYIP